MTPADELRQAAKKIWDLVAAAKLADHPRWMERLSKTVGTPLVVNDEDVPTVCVQTFSANYEAVNAYLVGFASPAVALAVQSWLVDTADSMSDENAREVTYPDRANNQTEVEGATEGHSNREAEWTSALAAARAINATKES